MKISLLILGFISVIIGCALCDNIVKEPWRTGGGIFGPLSLFGGIAILLYGYFA